jgi:DNA-binding transcriptional ArsR family regulator
MFVQPALGKERFCLPPPSGGEACIVQTEDPEGRLAEMLGAIANPLRLRLVRRLQRPAFIPDLTKEFGMTRQAIKKHLDELASAGLVESAMRRRGTMPASQFFTDPTSFFTLREMVSDLGLTEATAALPRVTRVAAGGNAARQPGGAGLLMVHGDLAGRWFSLEGRSTCVVGRDAKADVSLGYDGYASGRHAMLQAEGTGWRLTDLHSTNGTRLNFLRLPRGGAAALAHGDIVSIGRTHLVLRQRR